MSSEKYHYWVKQLQKIADLRYTQALLEWDQETYMPEKGAEFRGQQISTLASIAHEMFTSEELHLKTLELLQADYLLSAEKKNVELVHRDITKEKKLPGAFVEKLSRATSTAFHAWHKAKTNNDFSIFREDLEKMVSIKREQAELIGYKSHPYNALLDEFEPGTDVAFLENIFTDIKTKLKPLLDKILSKKIDNPNLLHGTFSKEKSLELSVFILQKMGYNMKAGRQDEAAHPFCTTISPLDVRTTTRYTPGLFADMLLSTIHEGGHALYEQGLLPENYGLPAGSATSLGIHESQSRFWENNIGRSKPFWTGLYPTLQQIFGPEIAPLQPDDFYYGVNEITPSLIRTQADELTYHFHILIRYEIEKALIGKEIEVKDLPAVWNEQYEKYLGIKVPSDDKGVLQDVHWAHGGFGYFPTYSLGSFYAAQFFHTANKSLKNLSSDIGCLEFGRLKTWLNENIHQYGRLKSADEICKDVTGESLNIEYFIEYIKEKHLI